jgi:hypothetical protein
MVCQEDSAGRLENALAPVLREDVGFALASAEELLDSALSQAKDDRDKHYSNG